jgi:prepilin-type N-terminal cleavage/methylation domain-containing protein
MQLKSYRSQVATRGLTLIELVVVLAILVALAGLIIGNFPGLINKAVGATSANTLQDIGRSLQAQYITKNTYGTGYDSLLDSTGIAFSSLPPGCTDPNQLTVATLTAPDATALTNIGLTNV